MRKEFNSYGKLLLSGEYVVLDGALSLAIPTTYGQSLSIEETKGTKIYWTSLTIEKTSWFDAVIDISNFSIEKTNNQEIATVLLKILEQAKLLNANFLSSGKGGKVTTQLEFPQNWGLGSSSTLINNIAQWAQVNPYTLLWNAFSGSGYDIACAQNANPITYQLKNKKPVITNAHFNPSFKDKLYFIYLNKKQNSREGIALYKQYSENKTAIIQDISNITQGIIECDILQDFEQLIEKHETLIASVIKRPKIKDQLFPDFNGSIKSLGAWGGDFVLAIGNENTPSYFKSKGYSTVIPYTKMVLK